MNYLLIYMAIGFVVALLVIKQKLDNEWTEPLLLVLYPFTLLLLLFFWALEKLGWDMDVAGSTYKQQAEIPIKCFDFRKPTYPGRKGFAITIFYIEFQFWRYKE